MLKETQAKDEGKQQERSKVSSKYRFTELKLLYCSLLLSTILYFLKNAVSEKAF